MLIAAAAAGLLLLAGAGQDVALALRPDLLEHKVWLLDLDQEHNLYAWFSSALLLAAALSLLTISERARLRADRFAGHWLLLGLVFVGLSADEVVGLHEKLSTALQRAAGTSGALFPAWVIPALIACAAGALAYLPFLRALTAPVRRLMLLAAVLYVGGAAGVEMLEGGYIEHGRWNDPVYRALMTLEEGLEAAGLLVLLYALTLQRRLDAAPLTAGRSGSP